MMARTVVFSSPGRISAKDRQLVWDGEDGKHATMPIEDLGFVMAESERISVSAHAMRELAEMNVALVVCDAAHLPCAQLQPFAAHSTMQETVSAQLAASDAALGRLWRQLVRQKIRNQSALLKFLGRGEAAAKLAELAAAVKNRDPMNCEAQAARIYFGELMPEGVRRDPDGEWPNAPLNYGYAVLRAAVARALVGSGLLLLRGIHHHSRYDPFCLADDVMEPYRPFVDQYVLGRVRPFDVPAAELDRPMRARLLETLTCDVRLGEMKRPLMVALSCTSASLARCFLGKADELALPETTL